MTTYSKDTVFKLKALGIYQLMFGIIAFAITVAFLIRDGLHYMPVIALNAVIITLNLFGVFCGILCYQQRNHALQYSTVNQYIQLVSFSIVGYGLKYVAGPELYLGIDLADGFMIRLNAQLLPIWNVQVGINSNVILVNCNMVAMGVIIIIDKLKKRIAAEEEMELLKIGME